MKRSLFITILLFSLSPLTAHTANTTFTGQEQDASGDKKQAARISERSLTNIS